jgi:hypothetical protein
MRGLGCERQRQVSVSAARRVVMDANTIKTCVLAAGDESCEIRQGPTDRNSKSDANPGHSNELLQFHAPITSKISTDRSRKPGLKGFSADS